MDPARLRSLLETHWPVRVRIGPHGQAVWLRRHDTTITDDTVVVDTTDGDLRVPIDRIGSVAVGHTHTTPQA